MKRAKKTEFRDLTDAQWAAIESALPEGATRGSATAREQITLALFCFARAGSSEDHFDAGQLAAAHRRFANAARELLRACNPILFSESTDEEAEHAVKRLTSELADRAAYSDGEALQLAGSPQITAHVAGDRPHNTNLELRLPKSATANRKQRKEANAGLDRFVGELIKIWISLGGGVAHSAKDGNAAPLVRFLKVTSAQIFESPAADTAVSGWIRKWMGWIQVTGTISRLC